MRSRVLASGVISAPYYCALRLLLRVTRSLCFGVVETLDWYEALPARTIRARQ
jgi:hypothetical protein